MADDQSGIRINAKMLPFPKSISPEAQAVLRRLVNDDGVPINSLHVLPAIDDHRAWITLKTMVDSNYSTMADSLGSTLGSRSETVKTGETTIHVATPAVLGDMGCALIDLHGERLFLAAVRHAR